MSYLGTYQNNELGFNPAFASFIVIIGSSVRAIVSRPIGKFADKFSFCKMLYICFGVEALAFLSAAFITPANGKVMYIVFYILYCIGCAGINSSIINLIYDYVGENERTGALALVNTASGFAGFFATLAVSPLVDYVQKNGNRIFGLNLFAQQLLPVFSLVFVGVILLYLIFVISKLKRNERA